LQVTGGEGLARRKRNSKVMKNEEIPRLLVLEQCQWDVIGNAIEGEQSIAEGSA